MNKKPSFFKIEQYLSGELGGIEALQFEALLDADPALREYVQSQRSIRYAGDMPNFHSEQRIVPVGGESIFSALRKKVGDFLPPLFPPQIVWAMGLCLMAGSILILSRPDRLDGLNREYTAKGGGVPFEMRVAGSHLSAGNAGFARAGDTLAFAYRGLNGMHVQIWYQDDGGEIRPYLAPSARSSSWVGSSAWIEADYKVVLFSDWNKESVWILWSDHEFTSQDAKKALEGGRGGESLQKAVFHLTRTP